MLGKLRILSRKRTLRRPDNKEEKPDEDMQKPKDEEEHVDFTLHTDNRLKIPIRELIWGTEDYASMLNTQETAQQQISVHHQS